MIPQRVEAAKVIQGPKTEPYKGDKKELIEAVRCALYASKVVSYAQGQTRGVGLFFLFAFGVLGSRRPTELFLITLLNLIFVGFVLIKAASDENKWDVDMGGVALMWRVSSSCRVLYCTMYSVHSCSLMN